MSSAKPPHPPESGQRIAKLLARAGIASRREIERMIADGRVALHGKVLDTPATVLASLHGVTVDGNPVEAARPAQLFLFHKPTGVLTAERDYSGRPTIYDRLPKDLPRLVPVGRLDLNTEGLLLLTTDGGLKRQLELPATGVQRAYRARAYGNVTQAQLEELIEGVEIEGVRYGSIDANLERRTGANVWIEMVLTEGKNREVRRVLEHLGLKVSRLIRTRYGPFVLGDLPVGGVGEVRQADLVAFRQSLSGKSGGSEKTIDVTPHATPVMAPTAAPKPRASDQPTDRPRRPARTDRGTGAPARADRRTTNRADRTADSRREERSSPSRRNRAANFRRDREEAGPARRHEHATTHTHGDRPQRPNRDKPANDTPPKPHRPTRGAGWARAKPRPARPKPRGGPRR